MDFEGLAKRKPNTTYKLCNANDEQYCKAKCGNKGVLWCKVQVTKKTRRYMDNNGKWLRRIHLDEEVLCECGDDDPEPFCGETCTNVGGALLFGGLVIGGACLGGPAGGLLGGMLGAF